MNQDQYINKDFVDKIFRMRHEHVKGYIRIFNNRPIKSEDIGKQARFLNGHLHGAFIVLSKEEFSPYLFEVFVNMIQDPVKAFGDDGRKIYEDIEELEFTDSLYSGFITDNSIWLSVLPVDEVSKYWNQAQQAFWMLMNAIDCISNGDVGGYDELIKNLPKPASADTPGERITTTTEPA